MRPWAGTIPTIPDRAVGRELASPAGPVAANQWSGPGGVEQAGDGPHRQEAPVRVIATRQEPVAVVEPVSPIVLRVAEDRDGGDLARRAERSSEGIEREGLAGVLTLNIDRHGEVADQDRGEGRVARETFGDGVGQSGGLDRRGREGREPGEAIRTRIDHDEGPGSTASMILTRLVLDIQVEGLDATGERGPVVVSGQRVDQELRICVRRHPSLTRTGEPASGGTERVIRRGGSPRRTRGDHGRTA